MGVLHSSVCACLTQTLPPQNKNKYYNYIAMLDGSSSMSDGGERLIYKLEK
jgi:hypothetical protein